MARTFNRPPVQVNTPSGNDVKNYFFNHYNWKGLTDNKNVLAVDQETFSDCKNVYVDSEGLLRSRPALKIKVVKYGTNNAVLSDITNVWTFGDVTVYESKQVNDYFLTFIHNVKHKDLQTLVYSGSDYQGVKLLLFDRKILVFSSSTISYYDIDFDVTPTLLEANDIIYTPVTKAIGFTGNEEKIAEKNILTSSEIYHYLYNSLDGYSLSIINKEVFITLNDVEYKFVFSEQSPYTFMLEHNNLNSNQLSSLSNNLHVTSGVFTENNVKISTVLIFDKESGKVYTSLGGIIFTEITSFAFEQETSYTIVDAVVSKDGYYMFVLTTDGLYIKSLAKTGETYKYLYWTKLLSYSDCAANNPTSAEHSPNYFTSVVGHKYFSTDSVISAFDDTCYLVTQIKIVKGASSLFIDGPTNQDVQYTTCLLTYVSGNTKKYYNLVGPTFYVSGTMGGIRISDYISGGSFDCVPIDAEKPNTPLVSFTMSAYHRYVVEPTYNDRYDGPTYLYGYVFNGNNYMLKVNETDRPLNNYFTTTKIFETTCYYIHNQTENIQLFKFVSKYSSSLYSDIETFNVICTDAAFMNETTILTTNQVIDMTSGLITNLLFPVNYIYPVAGFAIVNNDGKYYYNYFTETLYISEKIGFQGGKNVISPLLYESFAYLDNYYLSKENTLYISSKTSDNKLYFPEITKQDFDGHINNMHPISNTEVAIFFNDEVWYITFDTELQAYRYYKSKLQVGCKQGSDVLTTFDGKYTVFASSRGLVAMSYQDFIASDEQSLTYISDTIYNIFLKYITEENSNNEIKLFKFVYWLMIYKQDSKAGFIYDLRNNSWWPTESIYDITQFVNIADELQVLCDGKMYKLNKLDVDYFDYDGKNKTKIDWFIKSQKLHLSALNNYKHIVNMTFVSVHDTNELEQANYNVDALDFKLQVNNYRKKIDGNINEPDDYVSVNYNVETIRTFVQRLNYSKINEFQYMLSSDEENAIEIPLSINSITIKYKIGGQVR